MKQSIEEENRILSLLQSDPEAGLSEAMNAYGSTVKWIAGCVLGAGQREDVEECVAETFVRLRQPLPAPCFSGAGGWYTCTDVRATVTVQLCVRHCPARSH